MRAAVAMGTDINHEGPGRDLDLVGAEQEHDLERTGCRHLLHIAAARTGHEADVERPHPRRRRVEDRITVPAGRARALRGAGGERGDGCAVGPRQCAHADDHQRMFRLLQDLAELMRAARDIRQRLRPRAEIVVGIGEIDPLADHADRDGAAAPALADAAVEHGRFPPRIAADNQQCIGFLDAGNGRVEEVARPPPFGIERGTILAAVEIGDSEPRHQILERESLLDRGKITDDGADAGRVGLLDFRGDGVECIPPRGRIELSVLANVGLVETLGAQAVDDVTGLVGNPLLVHIVIDARQDAHDFAAAAVDADSRADRVHHVDRLGLVQFPRPRGKGVGLGGQRADGTEIDHVALQFGGHRLLEIGRDLRVLAAADRPEFRHAGDFGHELNAPRAMNAAIHDGLDQQSDVLVLDRALVLAEAAGIDAVGHRLVLQVAFSALVADRAVERMIDQQELHHPFARFAHHRRLGVDLGRLAVGPGPAVAHRPGA